MSTARHYRRLGLWIISLLWVLSVWAGAWAEGPAGGGGGGNDKADPKAINRWLLPRKDKEIRKAAVIPIDREFDSVMLSSLKRRVQEARLANCNVLVFKFDSGAGYTQAALEAAAFIRGLQDERLTVAYIDRKATHAAALVALSCRYIAMAPEATFGNIPASSDGGAELSRDPQQVEMETPLLNDVRASCARNGVPRRLAEAMIDPSIEINMLTGRDGSVTFVDKAEKTKLLDAPEHFWSNPKIVDYDNDWLTVTSGAQAVEMGLAGKVIEREDTLYQSLEVEDSIPFELNWLERAVLFLTQTTVRGVLFVLMLVLAYIEFSHPGISVAGIGALICLVLLVGAPYMTGLAQIWELCLIGVGVAIIVADLVVYGGLGLLAIPGFLLMAVGLVASFVPSEPGSGWLPSPAQTVGLQKGLAVVVFGSMISMGLFYLMWRYLYLTPGFRRLQLAPTGTGRSDPVVRDAAERVAAEAVFVGALGRAASDLRPAGKVRFGDHLVDVMTQGQFVESGTEVEVSEIRGLNVLVRPARPKSTT